MILKILHVGEYASGGIATYLRTVIPFQEQTTWMSEIALYVSDEKSETFNSSDKVNVVRYSYRRNITSIIRQICYFKKVIRKMSPDIIHIHSSFAGIFVRMAVCLTPRFKGKVVYCAHGWSFLMDTAKWKQKFFLLIEKYLSLKTDIIVNISDYEFKKSLEFGISKEKSKLIMNGLNEKANHERVDIGLDSEKINLLFVGRFDRQKGLDILFDFFRSHPINDVKLYVIGDQVLQDQGVQIPQNVHALGWIDHHLLNSYYQLFDAIIIPSRWEGFGLVALEAMQNSKALIVSNRGALPSFIENDNGYVFCLEDEKSLKNIFAELDKQDLEIKGLKGYALFKEKYTGSHMNEQLLSLYKKLI